MNQDVKIDKVINNPDEINKTGDTEFRIKLIPKPDASWNHAFDKAYNSVKSNMWRSANISGNEILISCHHSQLVSTYMPELQKAVSEANESCKKIAEAFEADRARKIAEDQKEKSEKEDILNNINDSLKKG